MSKGSNEHRPEAPLEARFVPGTYASRTVATPLPPDSADVSGRWSQSPRIWQFGFAVAIVLLLVSTVLTLMQTGVSASAIESVGHTHRVLRTLASLENSISQMQTGYRGYVITRNADTLETHQNALARFEVQSGLLKELVSDSPDQSAAAQQLFADARVWVAAQTANIERVNAGDIKAVAEWVGSPENRALVAPVSETLAKMKARDSELLSIREARSKYARTSQAVAIVLMIVITAILATVAMLVATGFARSRQRLEATLLAKDEAVKSQEASRRLFESLTATAPVLIYLYDTKAGRDIFVNAACNGMLGYTPAELDTMPGGINKLFMQDDDAGTPSVIWHDAERGSIAEPPRDVERRVLHRDGSIRRLHCRETVFATDPDGSVREVIGVALDVTESHLSQSLLRESEHKLRLITDSTPQMVWSARADGVHDYANERWHEYIGVPRPTDPDASSQVWTWKDYLHPDDFAPTLDLWNHSLATGDAFNVEYRFRGHDGSYRWFIGRALPLRGESGAITRWFGTCTDIEDQRRLLTDLAVSEQRFRLFADLAPLAVWETDHTGRLTYVNRLWTVAFGLQPDVSLGHGWWTATEADQRTAVERRWLQSVASGSEFVAEVLIRHAESGECRWHLTKAIPARDATGRIDRWIGIALDIHDKKLSEEELNRLVDQRTRELHTSHERLRIAERLASLGTLSAGLGHDMGNLLVPIRVRLDALDAMALREPASEHLRALRSSIEYLRRLSGGLRLLAVDPNESALRESTELATWWPEAEAILKNVLPRGISFVSEIPAGEIWVGIGRSALMQAVFNLVQNSGDAMKPRGSGTVRISIHPSESGRSIDLKVADDGPGMTPDVLAKCMEPFYSTKPRGMGTGLGLALVRGLIHESGGKIDIETTPGVGTTFTLHLPPPHGQPAAAGSTNARTGFVRLKDARLRAFVTSQIAAEGFDIRTDATSGAPVHVAVVDSLDGLFENAASKVVLLGPQPDTIRQGLVSVGTSPNIRTLRESIREVCR